MLAAAPTRDAAPRVTRFLRELCTASTPPRTAGLLLELARRYMLAGQLADARRELVERLALGRPYDGSSEFHHALALAHFLALARDLASAALPDGRGSTCDTEDEEGAASAHASDVSVSGGGGRAWHDARAEDGRRQTGDDRPGPLGSAAGQAERSRLQGPDARDERGEPDGDRPRRRHGPAASGDPAARSDGPAGGDLEDGGGKDVLGGPAVRHGPGGGQPVGSDAGGVAEWCAMGRDRQRARECRGHEAYSEARARLIRALELERTDASSHLLVRLLCLGGEFDEAVRYPAPDNARLAVAAAHGIRPVESPAPGIPRPNPGRPHTRQIYSLARSGPT